MKTRILLTSCLVAALGAAPATAATPTPTPPKIASYNVFMLARTLYPNWGQVTRADLIDRQDVLAGQDVVVLQELFDNTAGDRLLTNLSDTYPHRTPTVGRTRGGWDATLGDYRDTAVEDGGVAVLSRWPITRRVQHVYRDGCGPDRLSNKGFAYVRLGSPTGPVHVIGTHMQSEDSSCTVSPASVRARQRAEIAAFVAAERIPAGEPLYVAGDMNVIRAGAEYATMLTDLGAAAPPFTGHPYSWDCADNSVCRDQYGPEYASEHLDYVLTLQGPVLANETRRLKSPVWTVTSWFKTYSYTDYSDHYPVFAAP
ncbi:sphingomyelin phosphodiesterase [Saccharothrix variisporea]|uniref:Sphingomyelin phosphodiesterase n=1 Tax=Saccharothrix variisporea TaxID=543527 RepID=A0A495X293_9PSEU|nr:sphingomyelin phosphodiesterase [Saccharothrix variisporea]RKT67616.1 sphingomyelin phosphodiesterase [Saccharothrix variisporea]